MITVVVCAYFFAKISSINAFDKVTIIFFAGTLLLGIIWMLLLYGEHSYGKKDWYKVYFERKVNWLKRRKIPYDGIHYCSEQYPSDKYSGCRRFSTDVMIEDKAENIIALSKEMKVICFDAPYNRNCEGENILRAKDWDEVYGLVKR